MLRSELALERWSPIKQQIRRNVALLTSAVFLLLACNSLAFPKAIGPSVEKLVQQSDCICLARVKWIMPADEPGDKRQNLYSRVTLQVVETLKGDPKARIVVVGTRQIMEMGDYGAFQAEQPYLLFLKRRGGIYEAVSGYSGIFEKVGNRIYGWPNPGQPSYPKRDVLVDYDKVRKELAGLIKPRGAWPVVLDSQPKPTQTGKVSQGLDTNALTRVSDTICWVTAKWIQPADQPQDKDKGLHSRVTVEVEGVLKGDPYLSTVVIGTKNTPQIGDYATYRGEGRYLVFLVRKGDIYQATYGLSGVFERYDYRYKGWPKPGNPSFPKPPTLVSRGDIEREIMGMLKGR